MARVRRYIKQAGELAFLDASGGLDRFDTRLFFLMTHSVAGGLPLACFMTSSEAEITLTHALEVLKNVMPSEGFYGNGVEESPSVFLTDDCDSERNALKKI